MRLPWSDAAQSEAADLAACGAMLRGGSRSFLAASLLLPRRIYEPATALYAFCRMADDAIDIDGMPVEMLRARLQRAYGRDPFDCPADRALAAVVARHGIPAALPMALLEGFAWDAAGRRYEDLPALLDYAARVAGSVGAMMAMLMGVRAPDMVARACELGIAMQLSNIARDVGEDARAGRLYLPVQWLRAAGIDPDEFLADPRPSAALGGVIGRLLREADILYARGGAAIAGLPLACRPGISAARLLYADIGRAVALNGFDSVSCRAVVPGAREAALLARALANAVAAPVADERSCVDAVSFLVAEVAAAPEPRGRVATSGRNLDSRIAWLVELFLRLAERQQLKS